MEQMEPVPARGVLPPHWESDFDVYLAARQFGIDISTGGCLFEFVSGSLTEDPADYLVRPMVPCHRVLSDPISALERREHWPDHICWHVALNSRRRWLEDHLARRWPVPSRAQAEAIATWQSTWFNGERSTVSVGRRSLAQLLRSANRAEASPSGRNKDSSEPDLTSELETLAPFEGWEEAYLVVPFALEATRGELYFLLDLQYPGASREQSQGGPRVQVKASVAGVLSDSHIRLMRAAAHWWKRIDQRKMPAHAGGRPRNDVPLAIASIAFWKMHDQGIGFSLATLQAQLTRFGYQVSKSTLRRRIKEWREQGLWEPRRPRKHANVRTIEMRS